MVLTGDEDGCCYEVVFSNNNAGKTTVFMAGSIDECADHLKWIATRRYVHEDGRSDWCTNYYVPGKYNLVVQRGFWADPDDGSDVRAIEEGVYFIARVKYGNYDPNNKYHAPEDDHDIVEIPERHRLQLPGPDKEKRNRTAPKTPVPCECNCGKHNPKKSRLGN